MDTNPESLSITERSYVNQPGLHCHSYYQIIFPRRGSLSMAINGVEGVVGPQRWAIVHPGVTHLFWAGAANDFLVADLNAAHVALPSAIGHLDPERRPVYLPLDARPAALFNALQAEISLGGIGEPMVRDALARYSGAVVAAALVPHPEAIPDPSRRIALRARDYLEAHAFTALRIAMIADAVGVSERHLQRSFQAHFGVSVLTYLQHLRLREACRLLKQTNMPIHAVAAAVGFESQSYFTRLFQRTFGCTPMRYRAPV